MKRISLRTLRSSQPSAAWSILSLASLALASSLACAGKKDNNAPPLTGVPGPVQPAPSEMTDGSEVADGPLFSADSPPRILIVGDSITASPGCYKGQLRDQLNAAGITAFEFVGPNTDDCGGGVLHGAVGCSTTEQYTQPTFETPNCPQNGTRPGLSTQMTEFTPDLVMIQLGVNDAWNMRSVSAILGDYSTLVSQARAANPDVVLLVAQIHQIMPNCDRQDVFDRAQELVNAVPAWAADETTEASPVLVADLWTNSDATEADDCVHPNAAGNARMADNWFSALSPLLPAGTQQ